jgi:hypothetical protein
MSRLHNEADPVTATCARFVACLAVTTVLLAGCGAPSTASILSAAPVRPAAAATIAPVATATPTPRPTGRRSRQRTFLRSRSNIRPAGRRTALSRTEGGQHIEDVRFVAPDGSVVEWDSLVTGIRGACASLAAIPTVVEVRTPAPAAAARDEVDISAGGQTVDVGIMSQNGSHPVGARSCAVHLTSRLGANLIGLQARSRRTRLTNPYRQATSTSST